MGSIALVKRVGVSYFYIRIMNAKIGTDNLYSDSCEKPKHNIQKKTEFIHYPNDEL